MVSSTEVSVVVRAIAPARRSFISVMRFSVAAAAFDRLERMNRRARVRRLRTNQTIVGELLQNVRGPAGDAPARKDRRELIAREAQAVEQRSAVEIDVCVDAL